MKNSSNNKICRLCMNVIKKSINIFDKKGVRLNIAKILTKHFWFEVIENDGLSKVICTKCWSNTDEFHKFYNHIETTQNNLNKTSKNAVEIAVKPTELENDPKEDSTIIIKNGRNSECDTKLTFIKLENINNDQVEIIENNSCYTINKENISTEKNSYCRNSACESLTDNYVENDSVISKEVVTIVEPDIQNIILPQDDINDNRSESSIDIGNNNKCLPQLRKRKTRSNTGGIIPKRKYTKRIPLLKSKPADRQSLSSDNNKIDKVVAKQLSQNNKNNAEKKLQREAEDSQIREYFKMECNICKCKFLTFLEAKSHYREQHKIKGYISCCQRKFLRRGAILEHIMRHLNPEAYKCELCNKIFANKIALKNHIDTTHIPSDEKPFKCEICPKSFTKQFQLNYHIKYRHYVEEDKKFCCDDCGKSFMSKFILTQHIKGVHQFSNIHICDICAKVFKSKYFMEIHHKSHFPTDAQPKIQCNICGSWLKHKHGLQKHLLLHNDTVKMCPECGKSTPNRYALKNHIRTVHTKRSHVCKLCNKGFKQPIGLREHMASHTGQALYTCPHCPKTFNSGANMHSHRKKIHPIEWQENRLKRVMS